MTVHNPKAKMLLVLSSLLIAVSLFVSCNNAVEEKKAAEPATETTTPATTEATPKDTADTKPVGDPPKKQ
jgi:hypothetical protein